MSAWQHRVVIWVSTLGSLSRGGRPETHLFDDIATEPVANENDVPRRPPTQPAMKLLEKTGGSVVSHVGLGLFGLGWIEDEGLVDLWYSRQNRSFPPSLLVERLR